MNASPTSSRLQQVVLAACAAACFSVPAQAQDYPTRPVRIIVPFAPGGSADVFGRYMNDDIAKWARIVKFSGAKAE